VSDPFEIEPASGQSITVVTRRELFDYIRTEVGAWWGQIEEIAFLSRLYDLQALPSDDYRFETAERDILQHRVYNNDWQDDWVFSDSRFELASGPDEVLLGFLAQMVHPVVRSDPTQTATILAAVNQLLAPDGWKLKQHKQLSGRPVYAPARLGPGAGAAVAFAHEVATRIDAEYVSQQVTRMEAAVDADPGLAIGTAKEFVESVCKTILDERGVGYDRTDDLPALVRKTTKVLQLAPDDIAGTSPAAETIRRMLMNMATVVQGSAELRNAYGTGHGRSKAQATAALTARHARLAVGAAATIGTFLYETHEARSKTV
jgi:hypothetical protein